MEKLGVAKPTSVWRQISPEIVREPNEWPDSPFLIVERRGRERRGNPWCFLAATKGNADAVVYMTNEWPPKPNFDRSAAPRFSYENVMELLFHGWTPYRVELLDEPIAEEQLLLHELAEGV